MKLVEYSSRTRGFDGRIFVVRTVNTEQETVDRFFEAYLLWLFGFVLFCSSQGDVVVRYLIPHARRITDALLDAVPQISWGNSVPASTYRGLCSGVSKGRAAEPILLGCPLLLQL
jgi:hypothetical protein